MSEKKHIMMIRWYTTLIPYVFMIDTLRYNTRNGNVSFKSTITIDNKYVRSENRYNNKKELNKKFKTGRPIS